MPYISASIIFQLLGMCLAPAGEVAEGGRSRRKKINEYTRYATVLLCFGQSWMYVGYLCKRFGSRQRYILNSDGGLRFIWYFGSVLIMTCGTTFLMWLGEQIDEYGIGNGISLLIMAGILARMPKAAGRNVSAVGQGRPVTGGDSSSIGIEKLLFARGIIIAVVLGVVLITQGQRRIPLKSAKHVRGRRVFGGGRNYLRCVSIRPA